jgi:serine phosphatase RsbU (regulator of sigma subunit)
VSQRRLLVVLFSAFVIVVAAGSAGVLWAVADNDDGRVYLIVGATLGLTLLTALVGIRLVRRWVTSPIDRVSRAVHAVAEGDRAATVPATGPPEIARLAADVESMRRSLNLATLDATKSREAIEDSAAVLLTLRHELDPGVEDLAEDDWTVAARVQPAEGVVAGDCYDVARLSPSRLGLVVVDISGHGAVTGVLALRCRELLRAALRSDMDPGGAVSWAHAQLDDLADDTFLSAFVVDVDLETGHMRYANAGHPPALLCGADDVQQLVRTGPIVGPFDEEWTTAEAAVQPGDTLAIYTDGLIEVRNDEKEEFGITRLTEIVCGASCDEAEAIVKRCLDEVTEFAPNRLRDDATIVLLCRGPRTSRPA